ncbi:MAG TPA: sensor domain-containing protein [Pseudonocardiaceae bacterium]
MNRFRGKQLWRATLYLASYVPVGIGLFGCSLAVLIVCYVMNITWLGLPMLVGAAVVLRGCAHVERGRARLVGDPIMPDYQQVSGQGVFAQVRTRWRDVATWRDCAYLVLLFPALLLLDGGTLVVWLTVLAGVALPLWYWSVPGTLLGFLTPNLGTALVLAIAFAALAVFVSRLVLMVASLHAAVARALLGPRVDPLAEAKRMLAEPGPLTV